MNARMKKEWFLVILLFWPAFFCVSVKGSAADVEFRWAILADEGTGLEGLDFSKEPPVVHSGTPLQIYLEHLGNCYIYLFLLDSVGTLTPLYPPDSGYYHYGFPRGPRYIPPGTQTFTFVPPAGNESLYLIASAKRLFKIERLTEEFQKHADSAGQQKLLIQEIETLVKKYEKSSGNAEKRTEVERKTKVDTTIVKTTFTGIEVTSSDHYARNLLIDHQ
ncbi:MAG: hypothetical protein CR981_04295 [Proteobacteria bacterium]|nr:MAG: hypothetical protein CR981_04295 [Pseudomonadota bacterium]